MAFERVAALADIPTDRGLCVRVGELEIGLYRDGDRVFAMDDICPHAGYPLHEGPFRECVVMCTGHGWEYDVQTGRPPGTSTGHAIARYPVRVEGDEVLIDLDQPLP